jgi:hypothetical protein
MDSTGIPACWEDSLVVPRGCGGEALQVAVLMESKRGMEVMGRWKNRSSAVGT